MVPAGSSADPAGVPSAPAPFCVHYRTPLVLWLLAASTIAILAAFTWLFLRDGPPPPLGPFGWPLLGAFWLAGLAAVSSAKSFALVSMRIDRHGIVVREWLPYAVRTTRCGVGEVVLPTIVDGIDDDGDPRFRCELRLPDGHAVNLAESHRRLDVVAVRDRVLTALALSRGGIS